MESRQTPKHVAERKDESCNCQLFCECPPEECIRGAIEEKFTYHRPHGNQVERYERIREEGKRLASLFFFKCPPSAERQRAIEAVQNAVMWANAAVAINEDEATLDELEDFEQPPRYEECSCGPDEACGSCSEAI